MTGRWQRCNDDLGTVVMTMLVMWIPSVFFLSLLGQPIVFSEIIVLSLFNAWTGWTTKRRWRTLVLTVCTYDIYEEQESVKQWNN
ncbi:MAG: hypothetical protein C4K49_01930 [Candidatus Thorarchaeota archaeon]|nr:MAG: hypothetical protein C4K49_01930 [Candidatus Thorarchaeota archaeon]